MLRIQETLNEGNMPHTVVNSPVRLEFCLRETLSVCLIYNLYKASAERLGLGSIPCYTLPYEGSTCARVCVCVCVTERQRRGNTVSQQHPLKIHPSLPRHVAHSTARCLVTCVTHNRKKEDYSKRHSWSHTGSLQHYPLEMTQCWRILLVANLFLYWESTCSGLLHHVVGSLLPDVLKEHNVFIFCFPYNPEDEGGVCSDCWKEITRLHCATAQNIWFHSNHLMETSNHCFHIVKKIFISDSFMFLIYYFTMSCQWGLFCYETMKL
jgi:hypothetical protein